MAEQAPSPSPRLECRGDCLRARKRSAITHPLHRFVALLDCQAERTEIGCLPGDDATTGMHTTLEEHSTAATKLALSIEDERRLHDPQSIVPTDSLLCACCEFSFAPGSLR